VTHPITAKSDSIVLPEQTTNVKPRDIYALAEQPVIVKQDMEINSNMPMFRMMILVIQDSAAVVGRVLLIIVGKFLMCIYVCKEGLYWQSLI
jgi:hypothetical protein